MTTTPKYDKRTLAYISAIRYMNNAEATLQNTAIDGNYYTDNKYVSSACSIAYRGVLIALDAFFEMRGVAPVKKGRRASIEYYKSNIAQIDGKMSTYLNEVYAILHIAGYYELSRDARAIKAGFDNAYALINRIKPNIDLPPEAFLKPSLLARIGHFVSALFI
jgi:hypothetical protein